MRRPSIVAIVFGTAGACLAGIGGCTRMELGPTPPSSRVLAPASPSLGAHGALMSAPASLGPPREPGTLTSVCAALPADVGRVADPRLDEISGVVEGRRNPAVLFVHNDSGDSPRFFAIDRRGRLLAELSLPSVPLLIDAEDIAIGPGPGGGSFVYLGDTGNNFASFGQGIPRRKAVVYRVPEPDIRPTASGAKLPLKDVFPIVFTFPQGARDVEAFFVDPQSGDLYLLSKQSDQRSQLLRASAAMLAAGGGELELRDEFGFGRGAVPGSTMPTAASISHDGARILVRTYESVLLFRRVAGEPLELTFRRSPEQLPVPEERQGEAISFIDEDSAFLTISEGIRPAIKCARLPP